MRYMGVWDQNELYDIKNDPDEIHNLIKEPKYQPIAKKMVGELFDWLEDTKGLQIPIKRTVKHPFGDYRHPDQY